MFGHCGHGLSGARVSGGRGRVELMNGDGTLPVDGAETVGARVAATDDDHALAPGADERLVGDRVALAALVLERQVLHREVNTAELAPGNRQVTRRARTAGEDDRVEVTPQIRDGDVDTDVRIRLEHDALLSHQLETPVQEALLHLELGDAVAQQAAEAVGALQNDDGVAGPG